MFDRINSFLSCYSYEDGFTLYEGWLLCSDCLSWSAGKRIRVSSPRQMCWVKKVEMAPFHSYTIRVIQHESYLGNYQEFIPHFFQTPSLSFRVLNSGRTLLREFSFVFRIIMWMLQSLWIFFSLALQPPWALAYIFNFIIILQTVGLLGRVISSSRGLYLNTGQHKHRINTYTHQISMPCVRFEPLDPSLRAREDSSCLRQLGYCDRPLRIYRT
jgi:hypothetical protein